MAMNVKETNELIELARAKNVFLMEAIWSRVQPSYLRLKEELDKGTIGEVYNTTSEFGFYPFGEYELKLIANAEFVEMTNLNNNQRSLLLSYSLNKQIVFC